MKRVLREVALANHLTFYDRSKEAEAELTSVAKDQQTVSVAHPTVIVASEGSAAVGFGATNFAEAPSQIVVGFSKGNDFVAARKFSDAVVDALSRRWIVHEMPNPQTSGAQPLHHCDAERI